MNYNFPYYIKTQTSIDVHFNFDQRWETFKFLQQAHVTFLVNGYDIQGIAAWISWSDS